MLSEREKEITQLAANGLSSKEIGKRLSISKRTVEAHLRSARLKLKAKNTCQLISIATKSGFIASLFLSCAIGASFGIADAIRPSRARGRITRIAKQSRGKREWEIIS